MMDEKTIYSIKSKHSGRVLDICQDEDKKGKLIVYSDWNGVNQRFFLRYKQPLVQIVCFETEKVLTVVGDSPNNGVEIVEMYDQGLEGQKFRLQEVTPGSKQFIIYTFCGKVLDCSDKSKSNGAKVIQWDFNGGDNQKWIITQTQKPTKKKTN